MIGVHQFDGLAPKDALALELAAIAQHLREAEVVARRAEQPVAAALERVWRIDRIGLRDVDPIVDALPPIPEILHERAIGA